MDLEEMKTFCLLQWLGRKKSRRWTWREKEEKHFYFLIF
jgi:hypothetical protein